MRSHYNWRTRYSYDPYWHSHISYEKKTSHSEIVQVRVLGPSHYMDYRRHLARLSRDNPKLCSCCHCCNPRKAGLGNSRQVLSLNEGKALMASVQDVSECSSNTPNSKWRSRKYGKSTHLI